ncbi:nuclear protein Qri2/Nse4 [Arthroderma uncinatum]|uniref:nuclear protein Qri2/Nse4 n=1 Tax=Arthroderma uncinatum TaxID=74035 RepID=UPI00144A9331|nr:nuclear protein Qri2/Nse4 [Arthroderma uncinatum]KAF3480111.1 nuclear protein Qri2/Nse4 [Arthroderma uncinatum]
MAGRNGRDDGSLSATPPASDRGSEPSPPTSFSSDKENRSARTLHLKKRKSGSLAVPPMASASNKKRRVSEQMPEQSQTTHQRRLRQTIDTDYYDPDQDPEERRAVRKGLRELATNLNDSRAEFVRLESNGLMQTVEKANEYFKKVKQTSDATLDSRLLVTAADLSYKRTAQASLGNNVAGLDIDEFVSKCISFMQRESASTESSLPTPTQSHRRSSGHPSRAAADSDDEEEPFNWDYLGRNACFPNNLRPSISGFLLGPLSVQKRVRQQTQRRARERIDPSQLVRPNDVKAADLGKQETATLTTMCTNIRATLAKIQQEAESSARDELAQMGDVSQVEAVEVMNKHGISDDGGVPLFRFCINPRSFGQSVENLFYVSFLVRDGSIGMSMDGNNLPTLLPSEPLAPSEAREQGIQKHQAVFGLDFNTWAQLIETFDIKDPLIPHRDDEAENHTSTGRWHA